MNDKKIKKGKDNLKIDERENNLNKIDINLNNKDKIKLK